MLCLGGVLRRWCAGRCWCSGRRRARPLCGCVAVWPHGCFGRRRPRPLCVPAGGGPPASRPRREPLAQRVASKPGQAPPPPTGTAADPSGALHTSGAWCAEVWLGALSRDPARPRHRPPAPRQIPPAPSTPVGPGVLRSGLARCLAIRPGPASAHGCRRQALDPRRGCLCRSHSGAFGYALLQTSSIGGVFRVDFCVVVTNVVNPTAFSLKIKVFGRRLTTFVT